jgi:hypothetical protein
MSRPLRTFARPALVVALALAALPAAASAATIAPLPESDYAVRPACASARPAGARCLALQLVPVSAEALQHTHPIGMVRPAVGARPAVPSPKKGELGLRPQDLHSVYSLPSEAPGEPTIALIDAFNDPAAEADLKTYDEEFALPVCTAANGCFKQVGQTSGGALPFPKTVKELETALASSNAKEREKGEEAAGWGTEISLDIETAHAVCPNCRILLVEANSQGLTDLTAALTRAEELGATEISNSWGAPEEAFSTAAATHLPYADPGTVITASAGDSGYRNWDTEEPEPAFTSFPAASPSIVAVGGTRLAPLGLSGQWTGESVWNGSGAGGGGCSLQFSAASWQQATANWPLVGCGSFRAVSDISADADPYSGVVVRDSDAPGKLCETRYTEPGKPVKSLHNWCTYGGTSLASPIIASAFALAGGAQGRAFPAQTLYETQSNAPGLLHDITNGSNGECAAGFNEKTGESLCTPQQEAATSCASALICLAAPGYDGPSGVGTPNGVLGFTPGQVEAKPAPAAPAAVRPPVTPVATAPAVAPSPKVVELTSLGLTNSALIALNKRPTAAKVTFAFDANMPVRVRVKLTRRVRSHGRTRWVTVGRTITVSAAAGRNVKRLTGGRRLLAGTYRLTLTPSNGKPRSLLFHIG